MKSKSKKSGSVLKQVLIVGAIVLAIVLIYKAASGTQNKGFNMAAKNLLGKPGQRSEKDSDESAQTDSFWTSGKFNW